MPEKICSICGKKSQDFICKQCSEKIKEEALKGSRKIKEEAEKELRRHGVPGEK